MCTLYKYEARYADLGLKEWPERTARLEPSERCRATHKCCLLASPGFEPCESSRVSTGVICSRTRFGESQPFAEPKEPARELDGPGQTCSPAHKTPAEPPSAERNGRGRRPPHIGMGGIHPNVERTLLLLAARTGSNDSGQQERDPAPKGREEV